MAKIISIQLFRLVSSVWFDMANIIVLFITFSPLPLWFFQDNIIKHFIN